MATGYSRSSIYSMMKVGRFPNQRKLGPRKVGWRRSDIETWINERPSAAA
jgi:prophage regulatory protein